MKIPTTPVTPQSQPEPSVLISAYGYVPLSFHSHAARQAVLGRRIFERFAFKLNHQYAYFSVYSEKRSSKGGIYLVREDIAKDILSRRRKRKEITGGLVGIRRLRPPYDDLKWCY